ncbi:MAG TPA: 4-hydroxy-2-oxoheptanedioate aldolase [Steroidobacteraceae bacterium]|nr:4-hydroxy-2-oxoheptanedioate aldolase [Steroidobacteraceae bacterium]
MDMPINRFKQALRDGPAQIGLWVALAERYGVEICANAGFDWMLLDAEHAPNDIRSLLGQLQTLAAYPVHPVIRPPIGDPVIIKQVLDIGAQTLLVPLVESAEQAQSLVRATRYPPAGIRGVGSALARAARWNAIPDYLQRADEQICLLVQVETRRGVENLEAIAKVEGVDGVFIGPADLAAALGHRGNPAHPEVQKVIEDGIARARGAGKAVGILSADEALAKRYLELGCRFVAVGSDVTLLLRSAQALVGKFKQGTPAAAGSPGKGSVY